MPTDRLIYKLHIELSNIEPLIWRELYVDENITLRQLHNILQVAFGWELAHPHQFEVKKTYYRDLQQDRLFPLPKGYAEQSDLKTKLNQVAGERTRFIYDYDMGGHCWRHRIRVRGIYANDVRIGRAIAINGECNGASEHIAPGEYMDLVGLARSMDGSRECRAASLRLAEYGSFHPDVCDLRNINAALGRLANTGAGKK